MMPPSQIKKVSSFCLKHDVDSQVYSTLVVQIVKN